LQIQTSITDNGTYCVGSQANLEKTASVPAFGREGGLYSRKFSLSEGESSCFRRAAKHGAVVAVPLLSDILRYDFIPALEKWADDSNMRKRASWPACMSMPLKFYDYFPGHGFYGTGAKRSTSLSRSAFPINASDVQRKRGVGKRNILSLDPTFRLRRIKSIYSSTPTL
jgi:hypothetical protein